MKSSNSKTFHIQTTEMGIPLHGIIRSEPAQHRLLLELDAPFSKVPPAQRLSAIRKSCHCTPSAPGANMLRALFTTIIRIHQNPEAAANVVKEFQKRKAALEDQRTALRQRKRQVVQEIKAEKGDCPEKHKEISIIANKNGKLKQRLRNLAPECFMELFPEAIGAAYYHNFESYIAGPGQCPEHQKEVMHLAELRAKRKKTLQKTFARGWDLLILQVELDRYITKSDLCRKLEISAAETEELISKVASICMWHNLPCLTDVVVPDHQDGEINLDGPVRIGKPPFAPSSAALTAKYAFFGLNNPFESPDEKINVEIFY
jgi:hypothetical protein